MLARNLRIKQYKRPTGGFKLTCGQETSVAVERCRQDLDHSSVRLRILYGNTQGARAKLRSHVRGVPEKQALLLTACHHDRGVWSNSRELTEHEVGDTRVNSQA